MKTLFFISFICFLSIVGKSQTTPLVDNITITKTNKNNFIVYHQNGNVKIVGNYIDNKREGEWTYYYENGKIGLKKNFSNGKEIGEWSYYDQNGNLTMKVDDIEKTNKELAYYKDGNLMKKSSYTDDKKEENKNNSNGNVIINKKF